MNKEEIEEIETLEIDFKDTDELELALEVSSKKAIYLIDDLIKHLFELQQENQKLKDRIGKTIEYIEKDTRWFDSEYASIYGTLCTCAGAKDNRLEVMVNPSNLLEILKGGKE